MGTTTRPQTASGDRNRESGRAATTRGETDQYDLLTAVLLGVAVGTVATLLLRKGPKGSRPLGSMAHAAGAGAMRAAPYARKGARWAGKRAAEGAGWARERGEELLERVDPQAVAEEVGEYLASARETIEDVLSDELTDMRKAIKRRRKQLGI